jgi:hypothetical protein
MTWRDELTEQLAAAVPCGYERQGPPATEPTCLAAIALALAGRRHEAQRAVDWLATIQNEDGSVGPTASLVSPGWATALAVVANAYASRSGGNDVLGLRTDSEFLHRDDEALRPSCFDTPRAVQWLLDARPAAAKGKPAVGHEQLIGHDTTLVGWPWVVGTSPWVEPTALAVLALKSAGHVEHPRTREAVRLLRDRLMPEGGCNYGNTTVLGQMLRPHLQPTGLALLALHGEKDYDGRIARSLRYLQMEINGETATASLCYALMALRRYQRAIPDADEWLANTARNRAATVSAYRQALLLLAARVTTQSAGTME